MLTHAMLSAAHAITLAASPAPRPDLPTGWRYAGDTIEIEYDPHAVWPSIIQTPEAWAQLVHARGDSIVLTVVPALDDADEAGDADYAIRVALDDQTQEPPLLRSRTPQGARVITCHIELPKPPPGAVRVDVIRLDNDGRRELREETDRAAEAAGVTVMRTPVVGDPYPFDLTTIAGERLASEDLRGRVVLIDFWATWCAPCIAAMPEVKQLLDDHRGDLAVVGVAYDTDKPKTLAAIDEHALEWPHVLVGEHAPVWIESTGVQMIPHVMVLDREGTLRVSAPANTIDLPREIESLVAER